MKLRPSVLIFTINLLTISRTPETVMENEVAIQECNVVHESSVSRMWDNVSKQTIDSGKRDEGERKAINKRCKEKEGIIIPNQRPERYHLASARDHQVSYLQGVVTG